MTGQPPPFATAMARREGFLPRLFEAQVAAVDADLRGAAAALARPGAVTRRLARRALLVRLAVGLALALSGALLPDFDGGDASVAVFDLRAGGGGDCFALAGSFCACRHRPGGACGWNETSLECAPAPSLEAPRPPGYLQRTVYPVLLRPLTRWDAARFLRLAHTPQLYWPRLAPGAAGTADAAADDAWAESEPASAFLPFYPRVVQRTAALLLALLPPRLLPGTCEQVLALTAALVNAVGFAVSAAALFQLTYRLLEAHQLARRKKDDDTDGGNATMDDHEDDAITWATRATLLFLLNPANVFFGAAYAEALFGALMFAGSLLLRTTSTAQAALARGLWLLAARTRSNGVLYVGYLLLRDAGDALRRRSPWRLLRGLATAGVFVALSLPFHNLRGVIRHCYATDDIDRGPLGLLRWCLRDGPRRPAAPRPDWCRAADAGGCRAPFNLYAYVQRKYWNVGFLRYFTLKQIPNFLLAAPILVLAASAVATWIRNSWVRFHGMRTDISGQNFLRRLLRWALESLQDFGSDAPPKDAFRSHAEVLVGSNALLGHYAVLGAAACLGFLVAHVQISTRLLCSTCPALYWYMAVLVSPRNTKQRWLGQWVLWYCVLYNVLGVIMYPNWLPWT